MATKTKKTKPTPQIIEVLATKSINDISTELVNVQNAVRTALGQVGEALLTKKEELDALLEVLSEKKAELGDVAKAAELSTKLKELEEDLEDAKHEQARRLSQLALEGQDKQAELERRHAAIQLTKKQTTEDEDRKRRMAIEDEDRARQRAFEGKQAELEELEGTLAVRAEELGNFDEKVNKAVASQVNAIKRDMDYRIRTIETEKNALIKILQAEVEALKQENRRLMNRLQQAEEEARVASERASAIATAAIDAESGKKALEKVEAIAQKQAEGNKR